MKDIGKEAFVTSFKLLLYAIDESQLQSDEKKQILLQSVPFIKNWATVNNGEIFSCGSDEDITKEYQVYIFLCTLLLVLIIINSFGPVYILLVIKFLNGKIYLEKLFLIVLTR